MKFFYIMLLAMLGMFFLLYADNLSLIILIAAAAVPLFLLAVLILSARKVKISLSAANVKRNKGEDAEIFLNIDNRSVFPVSAVSVDIAYGFVPGDEGEIENMTIPLPAGKNCAISLKMNSALCRRAVCVIKNVRIYDYIHLFSVRRRESENLAASVDFLPLGGVSLGSSAESQLSVSESVSGEASFSSSPFSRELDELREYREGDKLNRVAWKLSGRTDDDEIIVRDSSSGREQIFLLAADISSAGNDAEKADRLYELFYSAAETMCSHEISFDSVKADGGIVSNISASDRFSECIACIYGSAAGMELLSENKLNRRYDKIVLVTASEDSSAADKLVKAYGAREAIIIS